MPNPYRWIFALVLACALVGCSSAPGVRTWVAAPAQHWPAERGVALIANHPEAGWAAEQALLETGWRVSPDAPLRLQVMAQERVHVYTPMRDPFCPRPWGWPGYYRYHGWYGPGFRCDPFFDRPRTQVREEITWVIQDASGQTLWSATSQSGDRTGPPLAISRQLAGRLTEQRALGGSLP